MSHPDVSVLMPVFEAVATLDEAIDSVLAQEGPALELVCVDDGSADGSLDRVRLRARTDPRIVAVERSHAGIVAALNAGLLAARAPIVARMDADDVCLPGRLAIQYRFLTERPDIVVAGCRVECFPDEAVSDGMRHYLRWLDGLVDPDRIAIERFIESPLAHPSVAFRRDVVLAAGGYEDGPFPEDYDLWLRLAGLGHRLAKVPDVLLRWREGPRRLSRTDTRYSADAFRRLKARHLRTSFLAGRDAVQVCGAGPDAKAWGRVLEANGVRVLRHFDVDPRKVGGRIGGRTPVLAWSMVGAYRDVPMVCAVGVKGVRDDIRRDLDAVGWAEGADYLFVQ